MEEARLAMRGARRRSTSTDPNAPFYVLLRDAERKILREAIDYHNGNESAAAETLGVSHTLVGKRARLLGGVYKNDPRREPFHYGTAMKSVTHDYQKGRGHAQRSNESPATESSAGHSSEATDPTERAADDLHAGEGWPGDDTAVG